MNYHFQFHIPEEIFGNIVICYLYNIFNLNSRITNIISLE